MADLSISRAWDETKAIFARDGRLLAAVALALVVLPMVIVGLVVPSDPAEGGWYSGLVQTAAALISLIGQLALIRLAIGPATTVGAAISHGIRRFPALFGASLLLVLLIILLLIPIVLILGATGSVDLADPARMTAGPATTAIVVVLGAAAVALSVKFLMTTPVASAEAAGPIAILKRSWSLTNGHYWKLLGFLLLLLVVAVVLMSAMGAIGGILGAIISPDLEVFSLGALVLALFVGAAQGIFTVLTAVMVARVYLQLSGREPADVSVPKSGT
jgi:hypothetical protein